MLQGPFNIYSVHTYFPSHNGFLSTVGCLPNGVPQPFTVHKLTSILQSLVHGWIGPALYFNHNSSIPTTSCLIFLISFLPKHVVNYSCGAFNVWESYIFLPLIKFDVESTSYKNEKPSISTTRCWWVDFGIIYRVTIF